MGVSSDARELEHALKRAQESSNHRFPSPLKTPVATHSHHHSMPPALSSTAVLDRIQAISARSPQPQQITTSNFPVIPSAQPSAKPTIPILSNVPKPSHLDMSVQDSSHTLAPPLGKT